MTSFDKWLTTQPENEVFFEVLYENMMDEDGIYTGPIDEWVCVGCNDPIGMTMMEDSDKNPSAWLDWTDCWESDLTGKLYCEACRFNRDLAVFDNDNEEGCGKWGCKDCYPGEDEE